MRNPTTIVITGLVLSALIYTRLLTFDAINGWPPVREFLAYMAVLFVMYFAACWAITRQASVQPGTWKWVTAGAVIFRLILLPAGLPAASTPSEKVDLLRQDLSSQAVVYERFQLFDDDMWRYLWDGHVLASHVNPYRFAPADEVLDPLEQQTQPIWRDIRENVSYPTVPTIYPPLAQAFFWLCDRLAPGSVLLMKLSITVFDLAAAGLLGLTLRALGTDPSWAVLYAWNPLVIKVFAGSGHVDSIAVFLLMGMVYCMVKAVPAAAGAALGLAVLVKLSPVILVPFFWRRAGARSTAIGLGVVLLGYLPFLSAGRHLFGGLAGFAAEWQFNAGLYTLVRWLAAPFTIYSSLLGKAACGAVLALILLRLWKQGKPGTLASDSAGALGWLVLLSPAVMPWYTTWALPFAIIARNRVWIVWTALVCAAFFVMVDGTERTYILALEYLGFTVAWLLDVYLKQRKKLT